MGEGAFKFIFIIAILLFCLVIIGIFLIVLKIVLLFTPELSIMGLTIY
ncbi:MAG: hypothetical protein WC928_02365 [Patescibacteria group bacterium]|jgi:hypothetical protein